MSIKMVIDAGNNLIIRKAIGRITLGDVIKSNEETPEHPYFHPGMNVVWDLTQADVSHFTTLDLKALVKMIIDQVSWRGSGYKLAIAAPKEMDFIVSSTFSIIGQIDSIPIDVRVFHTFRKAFDWSLLREPVPETPATLALT